MSSSKYRNTFSQAENEFIGFNPLFFDPYFLDTYLSVEQTKNAQTALIKWFMFLHYYLKITIIKVLNKMPYLLLLKMKSFLKKQY